MWRKTKKSKPEVHPTKMSGYELLVEDDHQQQQPQQNQASSRIASLDVFRGLSVFLMILVDYGCAIVPIIGHSPWNGLHLADFVMPFFLFAVGISIALVYKRKSNRVNATWKALLRGLKLFFLGVVLQGGYLHGINSLTYGIDMERVRWLGILQRIAIAYTITALCEIWLPIQKYKERLSLKNFSWHWCVAFSLSAIYLGLLYGLYVPDWQFEVVPAATSISSNETYSYTVPCSVRGDVGPACNAAGMIDRYVLGINHLYKKPGYQNLKECKIPTSVNGSDSSPAWCHAPFDPEGILSSLTSTVACLIGLYYGHILIQLQDSKERLKSWSIVSTFILAVGCLFALFGVPVNKSLYTTSYLLITSAAAGFTFCSLYLLVDVHGYRRLTYVFEWMGVHSLGIFVVVASNLAIIVIQGFYWEAPQNNIVSVKPYTLHNTSKISTRSMQICMTQLQDKLPIFHVLILCVCLIGSLVRSPSSGLMT